MLGGVCAGLGEYFDVDPTLMRLIFVVGMFVLNLPLVLIYLLMWIIVPVEPQVTVVDHPIVK
jgi:phage shock protein C